MSLPANLAQSYRRITDHPHGEDTLTADGNGVSETAFFVGPQGQEFQDLVGAAKEALEGSVRVLPWYDLAEPGSVTEDVVYQITNASCVLADLRGDNPNVYYEVGLAHAFERPVIPFIAEGSSPAFNIHDQRAIAVRMESGSIANKESLMEQLRKATSRLRSSQNRTAIAAVRMRARYPGPDGVGGLRLAQNATAVLDPDILRDAWLDLARRGQLQSPASGTVVPGTAVIHTLYGAGVITGIGPGGPDQSLTIYFDAGPSILPASAPGLFLLSPNGT